MGGSGMWVASLGLIVVKTLIFFPSLGNELASVTWGRMPCHSLVRVAFLFDSVSSMRKHTAWISLHRHNDRRRNHEHITFRRKKTELFGEIPLRIVLLKMRCHALWQFEQTFGIQMADFFSVDLAERGCFNELCHAVK